MIEVYSMPTIDLLPGTRGNGATRGGCPGGSFRTMGEKAQSLQIIDGSRVSGQEPCIC